MKFSIRRLISSAWSICGPWPVLEMISARAPGIRRGTRYLVPSLQGELGGVLAGSVIRRAWRNARKAVLPPHVFGSPIGRRVYDNRNTRLTKWPNDGIPPTQVAEWPGTASPCS